MTGFQNHIHGKPEATTVNVIKFNLFSRSEIFQSSRSQQFTYPVALIWPQSTQPGTRTAVITKKNLLKQLLYTCIQFRINTSTMPTGIQKCVQRRSICACANGHDSQWCGSPLWARSVKACWLQYLNLPTYLNGIAHSNNYSRKTLKQNKKGILLSTSMRKFKWEWSDTNFIGEFSYQISLGYTSAGILWFQWSKKVTGLQITFLKVF